MNIEKQAIIDYFNKQAKIWDEQTIRDDGKVAFILDKAGVGRDKSILDVACGTGVLFPDYLACNVKKILGVDIASKMVDVAQEKYKDNEKVELLVGDIAEIQLSEKFDCILIYNALPHLPSVSDLISRLSDLLKPEGRLTVAHGMGRAWINQIHDLTPEQVSADLMSAEDLAKIISLSLNVDTVIDNAEMYMVSAYK